MRASSAIGRAVRVGRTSPVRAGSTNTAMPCALIAGDRAELAGPADRGPRDPAVGMRRSRRPAPPRRRRRRARAARTVRPIHTRAGVCACGAITVRLCDEAATSSPLLRRRARRHRARPDRAADRRTRSRPRSPRRRASFRRPCGDRLAEAVVDEPPAPREPHVVGRVRRASRRRRPCPRSTAGPPRPSPGAAGRAAGRERHRSRVRRRSRAARRARRPTRASSCHSRARRALPAPPACSVTSPLTSPPGTFVSDGTAVDEPRDDERDAEHGDRDHAGAPRARER